MALVSKAIASSYWRCIKNGTRTYDSILESYKELVLYWANKDLEDGVITQDEYNTYLGITTDTADDSTTDDSTTDTTDSTDEN